MSQPVTRISDLGEGTCPEHGDYTTTQITAASTVYTNNLGQCVIASTTGEQSCGHVSIATTGSTTVFAENLAVHRIADIGEGGAGDTYTVITGSPDVYAG